MSKTFKITLATISLILSVSLFVYLAINSVSIAIIGFGNISSLIMVRLGIFIGLISSIVFYILLLKTNRNIFLVLLLVVPVIEFIRIIYSAINLIGLLK